MNQNWDEFFMSMAEQVSTKSKDPSTKVGAVITDKDHRVVSIGFNGFARGVGDFSSFYDNREIKLQRIIHAEMNAILFAERSRLEGSTLYTFPFMPCHLCANIIIQVGIKKVITFKSDIERWQDSFEKTEGSFLEAKVELIQL